MKAKLPERQSKGVKGPPITESSYKRYTAKGNKITVGLFSIAPLINCMSEVSGSRLTVPNKG